MSIQYWDLEPVVGEDVRIVKGLQAEDSDVLILRLSNGKTCSLSPTADPLRAIVTYEGERHLIELKTIEPPAPVEPA